MRFHHSRLKLTLLWITLIAGFTSGFAQKVRYNYVRGTDFSKYKTYRWVKLDQLEYPTSDVDQKIRRAIDSILSARGLTRKEDGETDLLAIYQAGLDRRKEWTAYRSSDGYWDYGGWYGWGGGRQKAVTYVDVGTLNLDFYDVALKRHVWRGEVSKILNPPNDPKELQNRIDKAMVKLLRNFPR